METGESITSTAKVVGIDHGMSRPVQELSTTPQSATTTYYPPLFQQLAASSPNAMPNPIVTNNPLGEDPELQEAIRLSMTLNK